MENQDVHELQGKEVIHSLRLKPRKALLSDCKYFLKPGVDVCVLSKPGCRNARVITVIRRPHRRMCSCRFLVSYYQDTEQNGRRIQTVEKKVVKVPIKALFIPRKLQMKILGDDHCGLNFIEDCSNVDQAKLYCETFMSESAWLLVMSVMNKAVFEVKVQGQELVYVMLNKEMNNKVITFHRSGGVTTPVIESYGASDSDSDTIIIDNEDKEDNSESESIDNDFLPLRRSKRPNIEPDRYLDKSSFPKKYKTKAGKEGHRREVEAELVVVRTPLKTTSSTKRKLFAEEACSNTDVNVLNSDKNSIKKLARMSSKNQKLVESGNKTSSLVLCEASCQDQFTTILSEEELSKRPRPNADADVLKIKMLDKTSDKNLDKSFDNIKAKVELGNPDLSLIVYEASSGVHINNSSKHETMDSHRLLAKNKLVKSRLVSNKSPVKCPQNFLLEWNDNPTDNGFFAPKKSKKSNLKKMDNRNRGYTDFHAMRLASRTHDITKMIKTCISKIELEKEKPQDTVDCEINELEKQKRRWKFVASSDDEEPKKQNLDYEDMWEAREAALSAVASDLKKGKKEEFFTSDNECKEQTCLHDYKFDEEIGLICQLCSLVVERRYVFPSFLERSKFIWKQESVGEDVDSFIDYFRFDSNSYDDTSSKLDGFDSIVSLIPQMAIKLHPHQKRALNFIWKHIVGTANREELCKESKNLGGCIISHSPGSGKTFLIIAFIVSYLKLFPRKKPLILAPKIVINVWIDEFRKWGSPFPLYPMYEMHKRAKGKSMRYESKKNELKHVLSCFEVLHKWHQHTSVLLMSYSTYFTLTKKQKSSSFIEKAASILQKSPGLLILDEGHNPRSNKSKQRKALMEIETNMRVLLSGTLFQNNFMEYFNTLWLARPSFNVEVMTALKPSVARLWERKEGNNRESQGRSARKAFIENVAPFINSKQEKERKQGLELLGRLTNYFIDVYTCQATSKLPGIETYTIVLKSTNIQEKVLLKLKENEDTNFHSFGWEIAVTLGSVHPWLLTTFHSAKKYFTTEEFEELENLKLNSEEGSKVMFVIKLVRHCVITGEKVLVFCRLLSPFRLLIRFFQKTFKWEKGVQVLELNGEQDMDERAKVINQFQSSSSKVLLASTATSAEGISLTSASRVVFVDAEWNPSKTKQAIARVYRPGQKKVVHVYQLLAADTMEESKYKKTTLKELQARMVFAGCEVKHAGNNLIEKIEDDVLRQLVENDMSEFFHLIFRT